MEKTMKRAAAWTAALLMCSTAAPLQASAAYGAGGNGTAVMETLDRGIYAVKSGSGMFVSWRWNADDPDNAEFRLYRDGALIYTSKAGDATSFQDNGGTPQSQYRVDTVLGETVLSSETCKFNSGTNYFDIPLSSPGNGYTPNDCVAGDVDGDGQYEIFLKWEAKALDNSQSGYTDKVFIDCVTLTGQTLWRIDMGVNIRAGQHYTQMCVADFDCDGKAELITKTADGTKDGTGRVIGDGSKDYRNGGGYILSGAEYMTLFDGQTGAALDTIDFPVPRGIVSKATWGDNYGNRVDRFNSGIAYLDGVHPSAVYNRGYYTRMTISALDVKDKKLSVRWVFDSNNKGSERAAGQGNHNLMTADVDNDGKQEICMGDCIIDDNGTLLWSSGKGHGDAMHLGDLIPERPGLELWQCHEHGPTYGVTLFDAANGNVIFHKDGDKDTGRCCADNVFAGNPGAEFWGARPAKTVMDKAGKTIANMSLSMNFLIYWDGDLEREMLSGTGITKMTAANRIDQIFTAAGCDSNNSTKAVPCMTADLFGDWREELVMRTNDNKHLRVWCSTAPTKVRLTTLMHDMQYRAQTCCEQSAYNQPPHTSYYLGSDAPLPPRPDVVINGQQVNPPEPISYTDGKYITNLTVSDTANAANWSVITEPVQAGSTVFGDRAFTFTAVPQVLADAEWIRSACDSKKFAGEEAVFTAGADASVYVALDTRVTDVPAWLGDWTKTADTLTDDGNPVVTYQLYKKDVAAGTAVTLGALAQTSCVNYAVAVTAQQAAPVIGDINADGVCDKADVRLLLDWLLAGENVTLADWQAGDLNGDGALTAADLSLIKQLLL